MDFFRKLDFLYDTDFKFSVFKKKSFKTSLGGFLTVLTIGITCYVSFYFGTDLYYRTNPNLISNEVVPENYRTFSINKDNFLLYYQLQDGNGKALPIEPYIYFHTYYFKSIGKNQGGIPIVGDPIKFESVPCDLTLVKNETYFDQKMMTQFNCLNLITPDL